MQVYIGVACAEKCFRSSSPSARLLIFILPCSISTPLELIARELALYVMALANAAYMYTISGSRKVCVFLDIQCCAK